MDSSIKSTWMAQLAQPRGEIKLKVHTTNGYDPLGVLCQQFLDSTYTLTTGDGEAGLDLLETLNSTRTTLHAALTSAPPLSATLGDAVNSTFWATDQITSVNKHLIKLWNDVWTVEEGVLASLAEAQSITTELTAYMAAWVAWLGWLDTLNLPGGWRSYKSNWETSGWVLESDGQTYGINLIDDKLPEVVCRWADLSAIPQLLLSDSIVGQAERFNMNAIVDGLIHKIDGQSHRPYNSSEITALLTTQV
jgi:uncharacterized membrane protein